MVAVEETVTAAAQAPAAAINDIGLVSQSAASSKATAALAAVLLQTPLNPHFLLNPSLLFHMVDGLRWPYHISIILRHVNGLTR
ncbi:MAG: hypothetical protein WA667_24285 [Candidatus Nitrosopolaris sp.]